MDGNWIALVMAAAAAAGVVAAVISGKRRPKARGPIGGRNRSLWIYSTARRQRPGSGKNPEAMPEIHRFWSPD